MNRKLEEWKLEDVIPKTIVVSGGRPVAVAIVPKEYTDEDLALAEERARLVAAAPELYAACKELYMSETPEDFQKVLTKMRIAVGKVEGTLP